MNIGNAVQALGRYDEAIEYYKKQLEIALQTGDISGQGRAYSGMGLCFGQTGRFDESIEYSKKHLEICLQSGELQCSFWCHI
jgi:tetratricopeptide (TPR) repeat protein